MRKKLFAILAFVFILLTACESNLSPLLCSEIQTSLKDGDNVRAYEVNGVCVVVQEGYDHVYSVDCSGFGKELHMLLKLHDDIDEIFDERASQRIKSICTIEELPPNSYPSLQ